MTLRLIRRFRRSIVAATTAIVASSIAPSVALADGSTLNLQGGGAVVVSPKYEGSKQYEVRGFPLIAPAGSPDAAEAGFVQFRGIDDIRFRALRFGGLEMGPLAGYRFGRDEDDSDRLTGLGDVDDGLVVGAYTAYDFGGLKPFLSYHHQVTGDVSGGLLRFGAETRIPLARGMMLTAIAGASYADDAYMDAYFSVTGAQAAASGLSAYDAQSGIKDVYLSLGTDIPLSELWSLKVGGKYSHLLDEAAASPIVETEHQFSGMLGLTYRFSIAR